MRGCEAAETFSFRVAGEAGISAFYANRIVQIKS